MILLVASSIDIASLNIKKQILTNYSFRESSDRSQENPVYEADVSDRNARLVTLNTESVYAQDLDTFFSNPDLVIFMSRHSSLSGTPTLSVHTPGNLGEAELGGIPRRVSVSPANAMRDTLKTMARLKQELRLDYEISYECTHHGPSLDVPTMFSELGSSPTQWNDPKAAEVVAHATMAAASRFGKSAAKTVLGIGGPHYQSKFTRLALESDVAFGHMIPKYAVSAVDVELLKQCIGKTLEKTQLAVLDWKGIKGEDKALLLETLKEAEIRFEKA